MYQLKTVVCCQCEASLGYTWGDVPENVLCLSCGRPTAVLLNYFNAPCAPKITSTFAEYEKEVRSQKDEMEFDKAFYNYKYFSE